MAPDGATPFQQAQADYWAAEVAVRRAEEAQRHGLDTAMAEQTAEAGAYLRLWAEAVADPWVRAEARPSDTQLTWAQAWLLGCLVGVILVWLLVLIPSAGVP